MNITLQIFGEHEPFSWWINFVKTLWIPSETYAEYYINRQITLNTYNASFEERYDLTKSQNTSFIRFKSEEDVTLFLLKFS